MAGDQGGLRALARPRKFRRRGPATRQPVEPDPRAALKIGRPKPPHGSRPPIVTDGADAVTEAGADPANQRQIAAAGIKGSFARQGKDERAEYCRSSSFRWGFPSGALRAIATGRLDKMRRKSHSRPASAERLDKRVIECRVTKGRAIEGPGAGR